MTQKNKKMHKQVSFEHSLESLENIVRDLESGDKGLEDSLKLFENGIHLSEALTTKLKDAKQRVSVLTKKGSKLTESPLEELDE